ncbi:unnamed protein product [Allacma fusca]|uniref:Uncharacterized protein n=1 Tax=Allacma fusca TaxID=39272 RepID=A0A8J2PU15_9HEXA|nr:unnamed protein product [Allacma fusca]
MMSSRLILVVILVALLQPGSSSAKSDVALLQPGSSSAKSDGSAPSCQDVTCNQGEECVLQQVQCIRAPCYPIPTCKPKTTSKG